MCLKFINFILFLLLSFHVCIGQLKQTLSSQEQMEDFKSLVDMLKLFHPNANLRVSKDDLQKTIDSLQHTIQGEISLPGFYHKTMVLIQKIGDGHLQIDPFSMNKDVDYGSPIYNFRYYLKNEHIYIVDSNGEDKHLIGYELQNINGISAQKIIQHIRAGSMSYDGENKGFQTYQLNEFFLLPYFIVQYFDPQDSVDFTLRKGNDVVEMGLKKDSNRKKAWLPVQSPMIIQTGFVEVGSNLYLNFLGLNSLKLATAVEEYFTRIGLDTLSSFVLDLRNNTGGLNHLSVELLSYFISDTTYYLEKGILNDSYLQFISVSNVAYRDELIKAGEDMKQIVVPAKKSFKGKLYVLVNNGTFSNGAYLASHLKRQKNAVLVGDTVGGSSYDGNAGRMNTFILPNSKLQVTTGLFYNHIYGSNKRDYLLSPTVSIHYDIEDVIGKKDKEMAWVIELMKKTNNFVY